MKKQVIPGEEAREQILDGAKLLYEAVSTTLGPKGNNAVIEAYGEPVVTHDGVTVAKAVEVSSKDRPGVRVGVELIKSSSSKTNDNVGDGTTSSTILAYHLIDQGLKLIKQGKNPMMLRRELDEAAKTVLSKLETLKEDVKTKEAMIQVATISSENKEIGRQVGTMYHKLGKDAMVAVEMGNKPETEYEIVEGFTLDRGLLSPYMVTDHRTQTTTILNPAVIVYNGSLGSRDVGFVAQQLYDEGRDGLVLICEEFKQDLIDFAATQKDKFQLIGIKTPGFGDQRLEMLKDVAAFCGTTVQKDQIDPSQHGTLGKVVASLKEAVFTGGSDVSEYISDLKARQNAEKTQIDKDKIDKRISRLHAKVGQIRVGGNTEMEAEERKYLIDDAVCATEAAIKEGIVPGGGTTYVHLSRELTSNTDGENILKEALQTPFRVLMSNAGERGGLLLEQLTEFGKGFDVMGSLELIDLKEHGVIDPVLVIKQAITNAVSVAGSALTTGVLIVREEENDEKEK